RRRPPHRPGPDDLADRPPHPGAPTTGGPHVTGRSEPHPDPDDGARPAFASIPDAVAAIARGEIVVVVDDEDRENEGDLIMAAEAATPEKLAFFVRHTSGVVCVGLTGERCD